MTDEEINRKFDVVADHLASLMVQVGRIAEAQVLTDLNLNRLAATMGAGFRDVNAKIDALVDAQVRTEEHQQKTDEQLSTLTAVVDRYFREGRNGGS